MGLTEISAFLGRGQFVLFMGDDTMAKIIKATNRIF